MLPVAHRWPTGVVTTTPGIAHRMYRNYQTKCLPDTETLAGVVGCSRAAHHLLPYIMRLIRHSTLRRNAVRAVSRIVR